MMIYIGLMLIEKGQKRKRKITSSKPLVPGEASGTMTEKVCFPLFCCINTILDLPFFTIYQYFLLI